MPDWGKVLSELIGMAEYFDGCARNAGENTNARKKFTGYIKTLETVVEIVQDKIAEEDDGR